MKNYHRDAKAADDKKHYDSHLYMGEMNYTTNADFQLILRVFLRPGRTGANMIESLGLDGVSHYKHDSVPWGSSELAKFRATYKEVAETSWTNKCWLVPPSTFTDLDFPYTMDWHVPLPPGTKRVQCNLRCRLVINLLNDANDAHVIIDVVKFVPKPGLVPRDFDTQLSKKSTKGGYNALNDQPKKDSAGRDYLQNTVTHEIGHNLGIPHIGVTVGKPLLANAVTGPVCTVANQHTVICYEGNVVEETACRMGLGNKFCASDADPWLNRVTEHTGIARDKWTVKFSKVAPRTRT